MDAKETGVILVSTSSMVRLAYQALQDLKVNLEMKVCTAAVEDLEIKEMLESEGPKAHLETLDSQDKG